MRRAGIRFANVCLFVLACFLVASIVNQFAAAGLEVPARAVAPKATYTLPPRAAWETRTIIIDRNLFGSRAEPEVVVEVVEPIENLEETKLPLLLLGTASTDNPTIAQAAVSNKSRNSHEVVQIGDRLKSHPNVEVVSIEPRRIVLQNGPKREELTLENRGLILSNRIPPQTSAPTPAPRPSRNASRANRSRRAQPLSNSPLAAPAPRNVLAENLQRLAKPEISPASITDLMSQATMTPEYEGRQMVGVSISAIQPGSHLDLMGLKAGDRVSRINGIQLDDPRSLQKVARAATPAESISIVVNGEPKIVPTGPTSKTKP